MNIAKQNNQNTTASAQAHCGKGNSCINISKPCSIEDHLAALAQQSEMAQVLFGIWIGDKLRMSKMLSLISSPPFQTFSDHGAGHSEMILSIMTRILGDRLCLLGATDTWMLLQVAYRHDLGMYVEYKDIQQALLSSGFVQCLKKSLYDSKEDVVIAAKHVNAQLDELKLRYENLGDTTKLQPDLTRHLMIILARFFREGHAERSKKMLITEMEEAVDHLVPMRIWRLVADICAGHSGGKTTEDALKLPYKEMGLDNDEIHPRLLQVLLRLGDTLDLDNNRFNNYQLAQWGIERDAPFEAQAHIRKHKSLIHIHVDALNISLKARINYPDTKRPASSEIMPDQEYRKRIEEKKQLFQFESYSANRVRRELLSEEQKLTEKIFELEKQRQYDYKVSQIKCAASRLVGRYMAEVKEELAFFAVNWQDIVPKYFSGSAPKFNGSDSGIWWSTKRLDEEIVDLQYSISHQRASDIMQGASLYGDMDFNSNLFGIKYYHKLIFLREFVQNGMDAMKMQLFKNIKDKRYGTYEDLAEKNPKDWKLFDVLEIVTALKHFAMTIEVHYRLQDSTLVFCIIDNGCGIDKTTMQQMKEVGAKQPADVLAEVASMPEWLRPNGAFGIGMQSVYAVTKQFTGVSQAYTDQKKHILMFEYNKDGGTLFAEEMVDGDEIENSRYEKYKYGTMFEVEIPRKLIVDDHIFEGVTPFEYNITTVFKEIKEKVELFLGRDFFPLHLRFYVDDVEVTGDRELKAEYKSAFDHIYKMYKNDRCSFENKQSITCLVNENGNAGNIDSSKDIILTYNKQQNMLVEIKFTERPATKYSYRGLFVPEVENTGIFLYPGCELMVHHWGGSAEDTLVVSRNKLITAAKPHVYQAITASVDEALGIFANFLKEKAELDKSELYVPKNVTGFIEALFHYNVRATNYAISTTQNLVDFGTIYKLLENSLTGTHSGLYIHSSPDDERESYIRADKVPDTQIYKSSFTNLWYIQSRVKNVCKDMPLFYCFSNEPTNGGFILYDNHIQCLFAQQANICISEITLCTLTVNKYPHWLYRLSDAAVDEIKATDDTQHKIIIHALTSALGNVNGDKTHSTKTVKSWRFDYPLQGFLEGRIVVPGFEIFRGLNVRTLPMFNDTFNEPSVLTQLGNYFIWPFSNEQLESIKSWVQDTYKKLKCPKETDKLKHPDFTYLKNCKTIAEGLSKDNQDYSALISFVADNLSSDIREPLRKSAQLDYAARKALEEEIRNRYENIILKILWPAYIYDFFIPS